MITLLFGLFSYNITATPIDLLGEYNLIVFNNLNSTSEVEGKTLVGGNVSGPASNYGTRLSANSVDKDALIIGGSLSYGTTVNINNGQNIKVNGGANGNINLNGGGSFSSDTSSYNFSQIQSELTTFSAYLSGLSANSSLTAPVVCCQAASFDVGDVNNDVAVFNISDSDFLVMAIFSNMMSI